MGQARDPQAIDTHSQFVQGRGQKKSSGRRNREKQTAEQGGQNRCRRSSTTSRYRRWQFGKRSVDDLPSGSTISDVSRRTCFHSSNTCLSCFTSPLRVAVACRVIPVYHSANVAHPSQCRRLLSLATLEHSASQSWFLDLLYSERILSDFSELLIQKSTSIVINQQIALICSLISKTCQGDHHRRCLVDSGVLDALAAQLASWVSYTLMQSDLHVASQSSSALCLGRPRLSSILQALRVIIQHSRPRAQRLLNSSLLGKVFQTMDEQLRASHEKHIASIPSGSIFKVQVPTSCVELLLPTSRSTQSRIHNASSSVGYPPLDAIISAGSSWSKSFSTSVEISSSDGLEHTGVIESPLVAWLIYVIRTFDEITGLMATWLLAKLYHLELVKQDRETSVALLVIPSIVRMLDSETKLCQDTVHPSENSINSSFCDLVKQEAPAVLAVLTDHNSTAQKAAVDAGAIDKLSELLKETYEPISASQSSVWSSDPFDSGMMNCEDECARLGPEGVSPAVYHTAKVRETTFDALAALASTKDEYRKAIIENGVMSFIVRTLKADDVTLAVTSKTETFNDESIERKILHGNCRDAILAACWTARALSRSVSTLRTSLMDAGLPSPLFVLLKCQDMEIKIEATAVVCNLVLEFSPMREVSIKYDERRKLAHTSAGNSGRGYPQNIM